MFQTNDPEYSRTNSIPFVLRASPLATALYEGGIFFLNEINRMPEKSLSVLSSVLDKLQHVEAAMTGLRIGPKNERARKKFRFCCALNPGSGYELPQYIVERVGMIIQVGYPSHEDLIQIVKGTLKCNENMLRAIEHWLEQHPHQNFSARQMLTVANFATNRSRAGASLSEAIEEAALGVGSFSTRKH